MDERTRLLLIFVGFVLFTAGCGSRVELDLVDAGNQPKIQVHLGGEGYWALLDSGYAGHCQISEEIAAQ